LHKEQIPFFRGAEIRKHRLSEIDDFMHIHGRVPQASFDLGCQGSLTKNRQKSAFQGAWFLISVPL